MLQPTKHKPSSELSETTDDENSPVRNFQTPSKISQPPRTADRASAEQLNHREQPRTKHTSTTTRAHQRSRKPRQYMKNDCVYTLLENAAPHPRRRTRYASDKEDEPDLPLQPTLTGDEQPASSTVWWRGRSGERREKGRGAAKKRERQRCDEEEEKKGFAKLSPK